MKMFFRGCLIAALLLMSGCASSLQASLHQSVYASQAVLTASETLASEYIAGTFGKPDDDKVQKIIAYDTGAWNALQPLVRDAKSGAPVSAMALTTANAAVHAFQTYLTDNHIGKQPQ